MPGGEFVHLHVHSEYSMLDGAVRLKQLATRCAELGMGAVALTDHGNMFGAVQLHHACKEAGIRPIVGCEVNIVAGDRKDPRGPEPNHLVLLAASQEGYQNLVRLVSLGWVEGLHQGVPRIDFEVLHRHREGLVGLSACMGGHLAQRILLEGVEAGREAMARLRDSFAPDHFFVELQDHGFPETRPLNEVLVELARDLALPLVATNDCHYLEREAAQSQLALQCIGAGRSIREMEALHHHSSELFLKSPEQMADLFRHHPEACKNTLRIAEMCAGQANPFSKPKLPRFAVPEGTTEDAYLCAVAERGLEQRFGELDETGVRCDRDGYRARLRMELDVINAMGFPGYFLIVQDFINWAKDHDVPVGPGRGSGAGSLVAWALRITDLDPIPYDLLFERFLNPERVSMPDFDIDFCMDKREQVIQYVKQKYGNHSVGQIATFHQLKSRSVVRDVGRVMGMAPQDAGRIAGFIPEPIGGKSVAIADALNQEPRLKEAYDGDDSVREVLDTAMQVENLTRHAGMHAAGVVLSEGPIWNHVPVFCPEDDVYVTQYHKDDVEAAGLVKFDFLGLKTLTVIDICLKLVEKRPDRNGERLRLDRIPMDDAATFALLQSGETTNVFQLESSGMQSLFKQLKPDCFEDIVAAVALYRPGPMGAGMHDDFVARKHGRAKVEYLDPCLEEILKPTRGVIVYQEQVMQIARTMAGYTLGGADLLRRAMGKKKESEMAKQKATFVEGAIKNGHAEQKAGEVFDLMAYFAGYGFNKSHSAAYALITYQTAYLKAHYPVEFCCATMTADKDKSDKVVRTVAEARNLGITVLPPDVNESAIDFSVVYAPDEAKGVKAVPGQPTSYKGKVLDPTGPKIRFGLGAIKGIGASALEAVFEERSHVAEDGAAVEEPFVDLFDFAGRVDLRRVNKAVLEALVKCGAFDSVHARSAIGRSQAYAAIESAIERGKRMAAEKASGQTSLFGLLGGDDAPDVKALSHPGGQFPDVPAWDSREQLKLEKETLGFYVSGHPLDRYTKELARFCNANTELVAQAANHQEVTIGGSVEGYRERRTKMGHNMAFFHLEDSLGRVEVIVRPRELDKPELREVLTSGEPVLVRGKVKIEADPNGGEDADMEAKIVLYEVSLLADSLAKKASCVRVSLGVEAIDRDKLALLRHTLEKFPGTTPVALRLRSGSEWTVDFKNLGVSVAPTDAMLASVERLFGGKVCDLI